MDPVVSLQQVVFSRGDFRLSVDDLELFRGGVYALTGANGAGKSTLLRIMALLIDPHRGVIQFPGSTTRDPDLLRKNVTYVEQSPYLFQGTVSDNLAFGLKLRGVARAEQERRIRLTLSIVGLEGFGQRKAKELSSGETQRVALARALVFKPDILLLDEPTANIDVNSRPAFERLLARLPKYGVTVVFSTHDRFQAQRVGAELLCIQNGRMQGQDSLCLF
ncbi:MAG TPA: ABC transporter ATP-binding protein [Pelovirga sp.]|nr:ABC transporter ATP-binding protein [Pelovirga sp.]